MSLSPMEIMGVDRPDCTDGIPTLRIDEKKTFSITKCWSDESMNSQRDFFLTKSILTTLIFATENGGQKKSQKDSYQMVGFSC